MLAPREGRSRLRLQAALKQLLLQWSRGRPTLPTSSVS